MRNPDSLLQRFVTGCFAVLLGAAALWLAIQLIAQVWLWIALIAAATLAIVVTWWLVKRRSGRW